MYFSDENTQNKLDRNLKKFTNNNLQSLFAVNIEKYKYEIETGKTRERDILKRDLIEMLKKDYGLEGIDGSTLLNEQSSVL